MMDFCPFSDFKTASTEVLNFLQQRLNFDLWMITRTKGNDWIVLQAKDQGYGVKEGTVFSWADSFCSQMVLGRGPRIAPCANQIPAYAAAPLAQQVKIGAYVGMPLVLGDGSLFGTLCAIDPEPHLEIIANELPMIELLTRLLCTILDNDIKLSEQIRCTERATVEAMTDALTGLYNRRGWEKLLSAEENRCRHYGHSACVVSLDLDNLKVVNDTHGHASGDQLIKKAAEIIRSSVRKQDVVARVGGDEFVVLLVETNRQTASNLLNRLRTQLMAANIHSSLGYAPRNYHHDLQAAWHEADLAMYDCKRANKGIIRA